MASPEITPASGGGGVDFGMTDISPPSLGPTMLRPIAPSLFPSLPSLLPPSRSSSLASNTLAPSNLPPTPTPSLNLFLLVSNLALALLAAFSISVAFLLPLPLTRNPNVPVLFPPMIVVV